MGGNVCHLVLARLPVRPPDERHSCFLVPKYLPNRTGSLGNANTLNVVKS